jgi:hypothetical protein
MPQHEGYGVVTSQGLSSFEKEYNLSKQIVLSTHRILGFALGKLHTHTRTHTHTHTHTHSLMRNIYSS